MTVVNGKTEGVVRELWPGGQLKRLAGLVLAAIGGCFMSNLLAAIKANGGSYTAYVQPRLSVLPGAADVRIFGERR